MATFLPLQVHVGLCASVVLLLLLSIAYGFSADAAAGDATTARASNNVEQGDTGAAAPAALPAPATYQQ